MLRCRRLIVSPMLVIIKNTSFAVLLAAARPDIIGGKFSSLTRTMSFTTNPGLGVRHFDRFLPSGPENILQEACSL